MSRNLNSGCYFKLIIADDGAGIEEGLISRVFEPFFSTKFEGKGLGLAATQGITKNHGGNIVVDSMLGQGSEFTVWLPIKTE